MEPLTVTQAAERLGVPVTTIKNWLRDLPIPSTVDSRGRRRFGDEALLVLETINALRGEDRGYETIRRRIEPLSNQRVLSEESVDTPRVRDDYEAIVSEAGERMASVVRAELSAATDLAEKYARAAHEIGKLEERTETLTLQLQEFRNALAEAQQRLTAANDESAATAQLKDQIINLEKENAQLKARRWWQVW